MRPVLALALFTSCSWFQPKPDRTRYYVLDLAAPDQQPPPPALAPRVGLGPITLPGYLDRPELVTRLSHNELSIAQNGRWAEPLDHGFARALRHKLETVLGENAVLPFPWEPAKTPPLTISIDVERFEPVSGTAELWAEYTLRESATGRVLVTGKERFSEPLLDASAEAGVAAMSRALVALGRTLGRQVGEREHER